MYKLINFVFPLRLCASARDYVLLFLILIFNLGIARAQDPAAIPDPPREFRGMWIATVKNIDWPSRPGLSTAEQQRELIALLDMARDLHLNAVLFQARPACDAFYPSPYEPWSEYLTGTQGQPPAPFYDPLAFAIEQAHARGMEFHVWINPYRASMGETSPSAAHVSRKQPNLVKKYGDLLWLDPGEPAVQDYSARVIRDIVSRYDIDGLHFDDYFYPYPKKDKKGKDIPFPDDASWNRYRASGGKLSRGDWRRQNVNQFIQRIARDSKNLKPELKFGISPFGIWRPGHPAGIEGMDTYEILYADARLWLQQGWVDYMAPQLYWPIDSPKQSYPKLLDWWTAQNSQRRHVWAGLFTSRVNDGTGKAYTPTELVRQVQLEQQRPAATGHIHFSAKALRDQPQLRQMLLAGPYANTALPPKYPWIDSVPPEAPLATYDGKRLAWQSRGEAPFQWVVTTNTNGNWWVEVLPGAQRSVEWQSATPPSLIAISALDKCGNESARTIVRLP